MIRNETKITQTMTNDELQLLNMFRELRPDQKENVLVLVNHLHTTRNIVPLEILSKGPQKS